MGQLAAGFIFQRNADGGAVVVGKHLCDESECGGGSALCKTRLQRRVCRNADGVDAVFRRRRVHGSALCNDFYIFSVKGDAYAVASGELRRRLVKRNAGKHQLRMTRNHIANRSSDKADHIGAFIRNSEIKAHNALFAVADGVFAVRGEGHDGQPFGGCFIVLHILHAAFLVAAHKNFNGAAGQHAQLFKAANGVNGSPKRPFIVHNAASYDGVAVRQARQRIGRVLPVVAAGNNVQMAENAHLFAAAAHMGDQAEVVAVLHLKAVALRHFLGGFKDGGASLAKGKFAGGNAEVRGGGHSHKPCKVGKVFLFVGIYPFINSVKQAFIGHIKASFMKYYYSIHCSTLKS